MSIFGSIMSKIFGGAAAPATSAAPPNGPAAVSAVPDAPSASASPAVPAAAAVAQQPSQPVDVEAVLTGFAAEHPEKLDWRSSIVDLMKVLGFDSSHQARVDLARELHYSGDTGDSAAMNVWLHREVMNQLAANGGKVPADLKG